MRYIPPPGSVRNGPSSEANAAYQRQRERFWERQRAEAIARQPGGRARLLRKLFLDREWEVRARAAATGDDAERALLTANADELKRLADDVEGEAKEYDAMRTAEQIDQDAKKRFRALGAKLAEVREEDDAKHPPSDQLWRSQRRSELNREWQKVESQLYAEATEWRSVETQRNLALYQSDPVGDPAAETRRLRLEQETAGLTAQYMGQRVQARNRLLPEGHAALAAGNVDRATVILNAGKRIGVEDARLEHAIKTTLDQTVPHRKQALEALGRIERTVDDLRLSVVTERMAAGVGTHSDQVRDSSYRKMIEWRRSQDLIVNDGGGSGDAAGTGGAAAE